ncbi:MAG: tetratricopeptide repeat protein [Pseudomonadales bacterium]|nr:tetratricopeptide repeat protein [Pseudomonadales bacterium]
MPETQLQMGIFEVGRGDLEQAEAHYREALALNPQLVPGYLNLADVLRARGRDDEAREQLLSRYWNSPPKVATPCTPWGCWKPAPAMPNRRWTTCSGRPALETTGTRHRFVYAIALHDLGKPQQAIIQLQALLRELPRNEEVLLALANYSAELGQLEKARSYARTLTSSSRRATAATSSCCSRCHPRPPR